MNDADLKQSIASYGARDLGERKSWYSAAAQVYERARPAYPQELIEQVIKVAGLTRYSRILEVGCGPATATLGLAPLGCPMVCLEPNPNFAAAARRRCEAYPSIEIVESAFEEWTLDGQAFDAVLAASSFHWVTLEVAYRKASSALNERGHLILLWNMELQPSKATHELLLEAYELHAPELIRHETRAEQQQVLSVLAQLALESDLFGNLQEGSVETQLTCSADQYLDSLATYSPYLRLDPERRSALFAELHRIIDKLPGGQIALSYLSAFQITQKRPST
ncbi:trans-aconitate 2-methyltransferase [Cyanobium sp. Morenito 9A2]|uniref:class I SAM-dependent methyltransferase n=1 Tax=Cyanobium sp. Morenito 9A2 TaxID=2823718 RepID=UPI0020CEADFF|nr:class I SAM-dependent methyltransferase [Cyanobium sp. Morenito 9A2]MCP9848414.1 class I SAM-dependent methyltransferase [Cyanobium sp. Morenito 9A2]